MEKVKKGYTKEDLKSCLLKMGLTGKEAIMVHSSMKSIGQVDGGADTVVDALMEYFSDQFDKMRLIFEKAGAAVNVRFGDAECILCDARKIFEVCQTLFSIDPDCVICREEIPMEWWS